MSVIPTAYNRQASFTSFQTESAPTAGSNLEAEFSALVTSIFSTQQRLAEVQRDDGRLANLSVHPDALSDTVRLLLAAEAGTIRGAWAGGTNYAVKDVVSTGGSWYFAAVAHTSSTFAVDLLASKWILLSFDRASMISFLQDGTGAVTRTVQDKLTDELNVEDFRDDADVDDTACIKRAADALVSGQTLVFKAKTYTVSYAYAGNGTDFGRKVINLSGKTDIKIRGNGAKIRVVNHDISTNGGFMFLRAESCQGITVEDFYFDMTFTGAKNSSLFYPYCGALLFEDAETGAKTQTQLNSDITVRNCRFKLFHPWGQYVTTSNPYAGDQNNGYKLYSIFCYGDYLATAYANQNRNVTIENCTWKEGHNGYGAWVWAYNHVVFKNLKAESWVAKHSNTSGVAQGQGVAFIRYHQWHNTDVLVDGCQFRAKPCSERSTSGFEGGAIFAILDTNLTGDYSHGKSVIANNTVKLGNGHSALSAADYGVYITCYGDFIVANNTFNGAVETTNALVNNAIYYNTQAPGGDGKSTLLIDGNTFGESGSYSQNIIFLNGSTASEYKRRCKSLTITNNISNSQLQYFLDMLGNSAITYSGCRQTLISKNTIVGTYNTVYSSASTESRTMRLSASEATDIGIVSENIIKDKNTFILASTVNASADYTILENRRSGVTTVFSGGSLVELFSKAGTFTPILTGTTSAGAGTYTLQTGRYTRMGNKCFYEVSITITAHTGTGNMFIDLNNIPYASANTTNHIRAAAVVYFSTVVGAGKEIGAGVLPNSRTLTLYSLDQGGGAAASLAMDTACSLYVNGSFEVA